LGRRARGRWRACPRGLRGKPRLADLAHALEFLSQLRNLLPALACKLALKGSLHGKLCALAVPVVSVLRNAAR
jgi:hypothetical protein